jgi:hypothetical protein
MKTGVNPGNSILRLNPDSEVGFSIESGASLLPQWGRGEKQNHEF